MNEPQIFTDYMPSTLPSSVPNFLLLLAGVILTQQLWTRSLPTTKESSQAQQKFLIWGDCFITCLIFSFCYGLLVLGFEEKDGKTLTLKSYTVKIPGNSFLLSAGGEKILVHFPDAPCYMPFERWEKYRNEGAKWVSYGPQRHEFAMSVNPITDNPKVQKIEYRVTLTPRASFDSRQSYRAKVLRDPRFRTMDKLVAYHCYEWQYAHSKEIAGFYNPIDPEQQRKFKETLRSFLEPRLADTGLEFLNARFMLN